MTNSKEFKRRVDDVLPLGERIDLVIDRIKAHGAYLKDPQDKILEDVLLPNKELSKDNKEGDLINVFIYRDSQERKIATKETVNIEMGQIALLEVKTVTKFGAFLDWGLDKDLLLPISEQIGKIRKGDRVLVRIYIDKSDRLAASQRLQGYLETDSTFSVNDWVLGRIIGLHDDYGAFVAVEDKYEALLPKENIYRALEMGEELNFRIRRIADDGRLVLSLKDRVDAAMDSDAQLIENTLKEYGGFLPYNDNSHPDEIREAFGMSKSAFKRAIGRLLKEDRIKFARDGILIIEEGE